MALLRWAVQPGVKFIDAANSYHSNASEKSIARSVHPYFNGPVIARRGG